jgi:nucleotidyltransferase/DNA polymerase involved in DNA repair
VFALVDVNSFYASCETVFRPDLRGKPVVVLSNNDGCIIARSSAAKSLGLKMGDPWFKVGREAEKKGVVAFSSNYSL